MKRHIALMMAAVLTIACFVTGCGSSKSSKADIQTYTNSYAYYEDGREGDVIDGVVRDLTFVSDTEYVLTETTVIAHVGMGRQVTNWTYSLKGTYTLGAVDEDEMTKEVTLSAPTSGYKVMNGAITTAEEDAEILNYEFPKNIVINYGAYTFKDPSATE